MYSCLNYSQYKWCFNYKIRVGIFNQDPRLHLYTSRRADQSPMPSLFSEIAIQFYLVQLVMASIPQLLSFKVFNLMLHLVLTKPICLIIGGGKPQNIAFIFTGLALPFLQQTWPVTWFKNFYKVFLKSWKNKQVRKVFSERESLNNLTLEGLPSFFPLNFFPVSIEAEYRNDCICRSSPCSEYMHCVVHWCLQDSAWTVPPLCTLGGILHQSICKCLRLGWILAEGELWNVSLKSSLNRYDCFKGKRNMTILKENGSRKKRSRKLSFQCIVKKNKFMAY